MYDETYDRDEKPVRRTELPTFVRIGGAIWLGLIVAVLLGALLAPHASRLLDVGLNYTSHRQWTILRLQAEPPFFDVSTPIRTVHSYYSALYRRDAARMDRLTDGPFRQQMRQRFIHAEAPSDAPAYRSFVTVVQQDGSVAVVIEKFHLFWQRGLRFSLQRTDAEWRIIGVGLLE
jgi:hypothetical protein